MINIKAGIIPVTDQILLKGQVLLLSSIRTFHIIIRDFLHLHPKISLIPATINIKLLQTIALHTTKDAHKEVGSTFSETMVVLKQFKITFISMIEEEEDMNSKTNSLKDNKISTKTIREVRVDTTLDQMISMVTKMKEEMSTMIEVHEEVINKKEKAIEEILRKIEIIEEIIKIKITEDFRRTKDFRIIDQIIDNKEIIQIEEEEVSLRRGSLIEIGIEVLIEDKVTRDSRNNNQEITKIIAVEEVLEGEVEGEFNLKI